MSNLFDTVMNVEVFAFIGLLVWLYFKDFERGGGADGGRGPKP